MVNIREYKYKIINDNIYFGLELEAKEENYYKNNFIKIEFIKEGNIVKSDTFIQIPMIVVSGIFYIGKELKKDVEFDNINLTLELGKVEYETTFNEVVKLEFDSMNLETRKISYKIINSSQDILSMATLNLVFFNKGSLVCGTNIKLENLLNERVYYFEYEIPEEIEFTEVQPYLVLPSTNHLLFKGFYEKYQYYNQKIKELNVERNEIAYEEFVDETYKYDDKIKKEESELKKIKNKIERSKAPVLKNNLKILLKNLLKNAFEDYRDSDGIINKLLGFLMKFSVVIGILFFLYGINYNYNSHEDKVVWVSGTLIFIIGIPLALFLVSYIPYYIYYCFSKTQYDSKKKYITQKEKDTRIKMQNEKIESLKLERKKYVNSIDDKKKIIEAKNREIEEKNEEIESQNEEIFEKKSEYEDMLDDMLDNHMEYSAILKYDRMDFEIIDKAIKSGKYTFEEVEAERKEIREAIAKMEKENEERMRQLEVEKRQEARIEALQRQLKLSEQRWKDEVREQQRRAEAMQREAQRQAWYREQELSGIAKQVGKIADSHKQLEVYGESFYNKYH